MPLVVTLAPSIELLAVEPWMAGMVTTPLTLSLNEQLAVWASSLSHFRPRL